MELREYHPLHCMVLKGCNYCKFSNILDSALILDLGLSIISTDLNFASPF